MRCVRTGHDMRRRNCVTLGIAALLIGTFAPSADAQVRRIQIEFPHTPSAREAGRDPRRSILERYPTREAYLRQYEAAAQRLVQQRYLLPDDAAALVRTASQRQYW